MRPLQFLRPPAAGSAVQGNSDIFGTAAESIPGSIPSLTPPPSSSAYRNQDIRPETSISTFTTTGIPIGYEGMDDVLREGTGENLAMDRDIDTALADDYLLQMMEDTLPVFGIWEGT